MSDLARFLRAAVTVSVLLGSLGLVTWRQSRAFEELTRLDELQRRISLAEAERVELERHIEVLESRAWVVPQARRRLGMHTASTSEMVILSGEANP